MSVRDSTKTPRFTTPMRWNEIIKFIASHQVKKHMQDIPLIQDYDQVDSKQMNEINVEEPIIQGRKVGESVELIVKHQKPNETPINTKEI